MKRKDLLRIADLSKKETDEIFNLATRIKEKHKKGAKYAPLAGKTLAMIFQKPSTRTRVSFESGMYQLGGHALFLSSNDIQLKRGETIGDTARTLSRYVDGIMIRTFAHEEAVELAREAPVPVINGLTDMHHPCQILGDAFTIIEKRKKLKGITVAWIGDGNNVCHSWIEIAPIAGINLRIACPKGYEPDRNILNAASNQARKAGTEMVLLSNAREAVRRADVIYTDVWASMGQEKEKEERLKAFQEYQVNSTLLREAKKDAMVMHCLPAHRGDEITDDVMDGPNSVVFDEAENRLHVQKAILTLLMGK